FGYEPSVEDGFSFSFYSGHRSHEAAFEKVKEVCRSQPLNEVFESSAGVLQRLGLRVLYGAPHSLMRGTHGGRKFHLYYPSHSEVIESLYKTLDLLEEQGVDLAAPSKVVEKTVNLYISEDRYLGVALERIRTGAVEYNGYDTQAEAHSLVVKRGGEEDLIDLLYPGYFSH
ncbi:MAG: hypothetical protein AAF202_06365, partial [Pseudomonadota bacterium]